MTAGRPDLLNAVAAALARSGLIPRGGINFHHEDLPPPGLSDQPARSVLLVGQAGAEPWPHFLRWRATQAGEPGDPLDAWSREVIGAVAAEIGARAVSPNDRPYQPFQKWAMSAEGLRPSPLGILMHPDYGLWHAYRGALLFDVELDLPPLREMIHLCDACVGKPCMKACPVNAHSVTGFDHAACLSHVRDNRGASCMEGGCLDRNACPYGTAFRYGRDQQAFHMKAFAR